MINQSHMILLTCHAVNGQLQQKHLAGRFLFQISHFGSYLFSVVRCLFVFGETGEKLYTACLISFTGVSLQRELANINNTVRLLEILGSFF